MKNKLKKNKKILFVLLLFIAFFSCSITITWDSTHYMSYVNIMEGISDFSTWDIVRGPVFPSILFAGFTIFGKTIQGALLLMLMFYLLYVYIVKKFCDFIFNDKKIIKFVILLFCLLNPIIFGYFHTLLTEFVAITIAVLSCYISYKWWNVRGRKKKIIYSLYFILMLPITWFLKQPYACCVMIPMCLSAIIALFNNHKKKQIVYYSGTIILSCISLIISIISWNKFLEYKNVNMNTGRDSSSMVSTLLIDSIHHLEYDDDFDFNNVDNNKYLSKSEKKYIKSNINEEYNNLRIISIYNHGKLIEQDVIDVDNNSIPSIKSAIMQVTKTFIKYPGLIIKDYAKNYCALSSICVIATDDSIKYTITNSFDFLNTYENDIIPYKGLTYNEPNNFYLPEERLNLVSNLVQTTDVGMFASVEKVLKIPTNIIYKLTFLFLPIMLVCTIGFRIYKRKNLVNYKNYVMSIILLGYSFFSALANAITGAIIDRYSVSMFITGLLGIFVAIIFVIENMKKNKS